MLPLHALPGFSTFACEFSVRSCVLKQLPPSSLCCISAGVLCPSLPRQWPKHSGAQAACQAALRSFLKTYHLSEKGFSSEVSSDRWFILVFCCPQKVPIVLEKKWVPLSGSLRLGFRPWLLCLCSRKYFQRWLPRRTGFCIASHPLSH